MMNYKIYKNVELGKNCVIEDYAIIGVPPRGKQDGELKTVIGDNAVIRSHTVIYAGNIIGNNFQTGHHVMIREENKIGDNVSIGTNSVVEHHIELHDNVRMQSSCFVPEYSVLAEGAWLGPNVVVTNALYPLSKNVKANLKGAQIGQGAIIGANCTLLPGVKIGEKSLIGAGSVVTKDIDDGAVAYGNPAKAKKKKEDLGEY